MGDFNGSVCPTRDYSKGDGFVCSMLARLLGPGGPFLDLQMAVSPNEFAPTFRSPREHQETWSRCDLVLGNRAAFTLIARVHVESGIMDGGHSPVVVDIHTRPVVLKWKCPQPRVPVAARSSSRPSKMRTMEISHWRGARQFGRNAADCSATRRIPARRFLLAAMFKFGKNFRWGSAEPMVILPRHFTGVKELGAHELQHNAAVKAVVVVTVPRDKLDNSVDWDSFSAEVDRTLMDGWGLARGVVGGSL